MAPKKRLPSPSLKDDQKPSTEKQPEDQISEEEEDSSEEEGSSSEEEEEEEDEDEDDQPQPASKNPPPSTPVSNPKPASESESGSDSGSESETDSEPEPTPPPNTNVKPPASKPLKAQTQAKTTSVAVRSGTKRPVENGNDSNRPKKKTTAAVAAGGGSDDANETEEDVKLTGEDSKKSNQRIFSEEDELTILKGLADFISKTGKDPFKDTTAFHSFVKKSLRAEANSEQLKRKVRTLKKKFETSESFTKPHDKKAFELFKKVWGNNNGANEAEEKGKVDGKIAKGVNNNKGGVDKSLSLSEMFRFGGAVGLSVFNKDAMKMGLELIGESKRAELEEKWKQMRIVEMELLVKRSELVKNHSNLILQALQKSNKNHSN